MKLTLFQVGIQQILLQLLQHLLNGFYVLFAFTFSVDEDIIEVYYLKKIELLYKDFFNIALEHG